MTDGVIKLEVDGEEVEARPGQMLIEVTDSAGKYVPRFCYHEKLSIAANCRMCLVEVEKAPKPLPACATPVAEGMKVFTRSAYAIEAQKATMEFLLINHPLDCPICDQGGECELQDLAMGYGRDVSRYTDRKRVVADKNIGPLVSTDMTRCIHCTRCVRFGQEVAGIQELGTTDRGENMKIGTFIEKSVDHELSGNIIDLCPVGALNNKPYRFSARAWEMEQKPTISPHDCVGSNLYAHVLRGTIKRVVPRPNEAINETWISDRDRFSYEGLYSEDRLVGPEIKNTDGSWRKADWLDALAVTVNALQAATGGTGADGIGILASPSATVEECFLLNGIAEGIGTANLDHRLRQTDFSSQHSEPIAPTLGLTITELERQDAILVVGSNIRHEAPLLAHRIRKATLSGGTAGFVNPVRYDYRIDAQIQCTGELLDELAKLAKAVGVKAGDLPDALAAALKDAKPGDECKALANLLRDGERAHVLIGNIATRHPGYSGLRALSAAIATAAGATFGYVTEGANSAGAALAGVLPHRGVAGRKRKSSGLTAGEMLNEPREAYLLFQLEPDHDLSEANRMHAFATAQHVVACTAFTSEAMREVATVLLPVGTYAETPGTFVNVEGEWQSFAAVASLVGDARPGWKVLRQLASMLELDGLDYADSAAVLAAARDAFGDISGSDAAETGSVDVVATTANGDAASLDVPIYQVDALVRHAHALQLTAAGLAGQSWRERG